ncbi:hypothetical protein T06_16636 [Trichinella sp. T6]|nr:hypothetical protein T06_16636 [Trichinella sp. T6]
MECNNPSVKKKQADKKKGKIGLIFEQIFPTFFLQETCLQANHFDHKSIDSASLLVANSPSIYRKRRIEKNIRKQCPSAVSRVSGKIYSNPLSDKTEDVVVKNAKALKIIFRNSIFSINFYAKLSTQSTYLALYLASYVIEAVVEG